MLKARLAIFAVATMLLAACSSSPSPSPTPSPRALELSRCAYSPIAIPADASLPQPVTYPTGFAQPTATVAATQTYGFEELKNPPEAVTASAAAATITAYDPLVVKYSDPASTSIAGCPVTLRTYDGRLVGPTVRVKAGQTLQFTVENGLPLAPNTTPTATPMPTCPSGGPPTGTVTSTGMEGMAGMSAADTMDMTNLHTHGLHVDPCGKYVNGKFVASDNVLIEYGPQTKQPYAITLPDNHPPGTFWYHAHSHGSTAPQMASGMAGALIVQDDPAKLPPALQGITEKVMVFQQIFYNVTGTLANLSVDAGAPTPQDWSNPGGSGGQGPCNVNNNVACRRITINGQVFPKITMKAGEVQRWRMVAATYDKFMQLQLGGTNLNEIAVDSLFLPKVDTWKASSPTQTVELDSGYRSDVLVQANSKPGTYMLTDSTVTGTAGVLAAVVVEEATPPVVSRGLPTTAQMQQIAYGWNGVTGTVLRDNWKADPINNGCLPATVLTSTVGTPCATAHVQTMEFDLGPAPGATNTSYPIVNNNFAVDRIVFPTPPIRKLTLGRIDAWALNNSLNSAHIYHIHVNPFQVDRIAPDGVTETVWRDVVAVPPNTKDKPSPALIMYTQYNVFLGGFVIHCHLVDHEDNGMMQEVYVQPG